MAGKAWLGTARRGQVRHGWAGRGRLRHGEWLGIAGRVVAGRGEAGNG